MTLFMCCVQIACRDYPHPRHLCAKFPFSSTQHDRHCDLCHCYVCDSLAPCAYWGTGVSSMDHCHAIDKQEMWKNLRENFRRRKNAQLLGSKFTDNPLPVTVTKINQNVPLETAQPRIDSIPQNQVSRPTAIRACSSTRLGVVNEGRKWPRRRLQRNTGILPRPLSQQALGIHGGPNLGNLMEQYVPNNAKFRRAVQGAPLMHQSVYGSSNGLNYAPATHPRVSTASLATPRNKIPAGPHNIISNIGLEPYVQSLSPSIRASSTGNSVPSQPAGSSQPVPQLTDGQSNNFLGNGSQNVLNSSLFDLDFGCIDNVGVINQQMSVENGKYEGTAFNNEPSVVDSQLSEGCQLMKDNEYESWTLGQSAPVTLEGCVASNLNTFSPDPPAIDAGMLYFDFETSWNAWAHA
uniref:Uncharacterized protein MANES_13G038700 n=1 Tax=Rhizophora mucronata TaxID=61149 RepID=A0A2P2J7D2_RHIMU